MPAKELRQQTNAGARGELHKVRQGRREKEEKNRVFDGFLLFFDGFF